MDLCSSPLSTLLDTNFQPSVTHTDVMARVLPLRPLLLP